MLEILERIVDGKGRPGDIELLESLAVESRTVHCVALGRRLQILS
jgi:NADH:ubiquinone oxidoreductase subunit F (NADH-binding)